MTDFIDTYTCYLQTIKQVNQLNKALVFTALKDAGVTKVVVQFDGVGDSGQIEALTAYKGEETVELPSTSLALNRCVSYTSGVGTVEATLLESVETLVYGYLEQEHDGWENNDGGYGTFEFDVAGQAIHLEFEQRFTDTYSYGHTF